MEQFTSIFINKISKQLNLTVICVGGVYTVTYNETGSSLTGFWANKFLSYEYKKFKGDSITFKEICDKSNFHLCDLSPLRLRCKETDDIFEAQAAEFIKNSLVNEYETVMGIPVIF